MSAEPDYDAMSIEELAAKADEAYQRRDKMNHEYFREELLCRRAARDAILDLQEDLSEQGLALVPREPTPRMLYHADGYSDLVQPFNGADAPDTDCALWRRNEIRMIWQLMIDESPAPPALETGK